MRVSPLSRGVDTWPVSQQLGIHQSHRLIHSRGDGGFQSSSTRQREKEEVSILHSRGGSAEEKETPEDAGLHWSDRMTTEGEETRGPWAMGHGP